MSALPTGNPFDEAIDIPSSDSEEIPSDRSFSIPSKNTDRRLRMPAGSPGDDSELMKAAPDPKLSANIRQIPSPASEDARNGPGGSGGAAEHCFRGRSHAKGATSKSKLSNNSANLMGDSSEGDEDDEDDEEEDEEDDDDETNTEVIEGMYNPADYEHLIVSAEVKEMFHYIQRYTPQSIDLDTKLRPFIPEYIAAVGDIDAFLKVPRPDGKPDNLGLAVLDEPCANQSDPTVLDLQLRAISKQKTSKEMIVRSLENAEKNTKEIEKWIKSIGELHRSKPPPAVHYVKPMPDVSTLMSEWSGQFEDVLRLNILPTAEMDCSLTDYVDTVCAILDIPVYNNRIHSLHLLFSLYMEFKNSQHFRQRKAEKVTTDVEETAVGV
uniref:Intraflagellar transport protein 46 homolog n=1 Tax=Schistocephalus solidus TaxID=70667 RepID=A0A0X3Q0L0_SCHSO